jgi:hypothetical protein
MRGGGVWLGFFSKIVDFEELTVWYSADYGQSWFDFAALPDTEVSPFDARSDSTLSPDFNYLFVLEVRGGPMAGYSKLLMFLNDDDEGDIGGDRTGTDRFPLPGAGGGGKLGNPPSGGDDNTENNNPPLGNGHDNDGAGDDTGNNDPPSGNGSDNISGGNGSGNNASPYGNGKDNISGNHPSNEHKPVTATGGSDARTRDIHAPVSGYVPAASTTLFSLVLPEIIPRFGEIMPQLPLPQPLININTALLLTGITVFLLTVSVIFIKTSKQNYG